MEMPSDWTNAQGWENYYASLYPRGHYREHREIGSIPERELPGFATSLLQQGWKTVWIPGCGFSALPKLLAQLGLDVHATDISPTAIAYQLSTDNDVAFLDPETSLADTGSLTCVVQDFRQPYIASHFDFLINTRALQGFPADTMKQVAHVHYCSLKPGRQAYFDTMNVQGELRDVLESSLVEAGFFLPFYGLNKWYRERLRETEIPHAFILGRPMVIPKHGEIMSDGERESATAILRAITAEYEQRAKEEQEAEQKRLTENDRIATVIYSTG